MAEVQAHEGYLCLVPLDPPYNIVDVFHLPQPSSISSSSVPDPIPFIEPYLVEDGGFLVDQRYVHDVESSCIDGMPRDSDSGARTKRWMFPQDDAKLESSALAT